MLSQIADHSSCSNCCARPTDAGRVYLPMLPLPNQWPVLVLLGGGGGFWIWLAVGARLERMEYVRCMVP